MATPINPLASSVVYNTIKPPSTDSTSAKVQNISVKKEELGSSSSHMITVIHPGDPETPLLEGDVIAPANTEVVLSEEGVSPSEVSVNKTRSIFERFCCCRK
ncbi:MAG: hypothetical protein WBD50_07590 [Candidatus Rhabdochlamydia sp.]